MQTFPQGVLVVGDLREQPAQLDDGGQFTRRQPIGAEISNRPGRKAQLQTDIAALRADHDRSLVDWTERVDSVRTVAVPPRHPRLANDRI